MNGLRTGLSYGDVLLEPKRSPVDSRRDVDLETWLTDEIRLENPVLSAPMDTVTESATAIALGRRGGFGTIHRFMTTERQVREVETAKGADVQVGAAVGVADGYLDRTQALLDAGVDCIVVDVAHAHLEKCLDAVATIRETFGDVELVAGNVATESGVRDLVAAGADCVKVGIGPGSHCTTREVAGVGVPQLTAVDDCATVAHDLGIRIVADGGIQRSGDAVKALMAGADTIMLGSLFAGTEEAPTEVVEVEGTRYKRSRGMATTAANADRPGTRRPDETVEEGIEALTEYKGPLADVLNDFRAGLRSGLSYCGGESIPAARDKATFVRVADDAKARSGPHGDHDWELATLD